jgi:Barrel-sandwich domain of CusB or HlyD membrane-fusion
LSIEGVTEVDPILISFAQWRMPDGGASPVLVIGSDLRGGGLLPWNVVEGSVAALSIPDAVAADRTYLDRLGVKGLGDAGEMRDRRAEIRAITKGIRSFTTTPYIFTQLERARAYTGTPHSKVTYLLVHLAPHTDVERVRKQLQSVLAKTQVLLGDLSGLRVRAEVHERDVGKIKLGGKAVVRADAFRGREFAGKVVSIAPLVQPARINSPGSRNLSDFSVTDVLIELSDPGPMVGMKVDVYFQHEVAAL